MNKTYIPHTSSRIIIGILLLVSSHCLLSCEKFVDVGSPVTSTNAGNVYNSEDNAPEVLTGVYIRMSQPELSNGGLTGVSYYGGLSADEFTMYDMIPLIANTYYRNELASVDAGGGEFWNSIYPHVFALNASVEGLTAATDIREALRNRLLGEARFTRAFCYFYLTNLYGEVPLLLNSDYKRNAVEPKSSVGLVYKQIETDLLAAQQLLTDAYVEADGMTSKESTARVRPNRAAATALLARTYLYMKEYSKAEAEASKVLGQTTSYKLEPLAGVFVNTSKEAIWQLQPVNAGWNTEDARLFVLPATGPGNLNPVYLSDTLLNSFSVGDNRQIDWIGSLSVSGKEYKYPAKYKNATLGSPVTEYNTVLRLAEQYLIRAEARAQNGNDEGAMDDLNAIRTRAGLPELDYVDKPTTLLAISKERQLELFTEWGHRWLDLKRTETAEALMKVITPKKGGTWKSTAQLYPIPSKDLAANPNLKQNLGY
ncbi:RagB/SusD family nutrient uptake outer membrane protein [Chitinophaga sp. S165]|uniref:RagB/SusD family nutrient uptake outer membrane protein n=1 Tax=Chitinophaga sp. S165 TaxID=2135462 RepID=UPI000D717913|nr:RagB/SusD family nutrient uptake outer membrane protein [Chitinophaga sp. S165]PWV47102.1 putative outer membrane starch-binding protein [Chitinophaga sp. S165]